MSADASVRNRLARSAQKRVATQAPHLRPGVSSSRRPIGAPVHRQLAQPEHSTRLKPRSAAEVFVERLLLAVIQLLHRVHQILQLLLRRATR